jgi:hypothetical protein
MSPPSSRWLFEEWLIDLKPLFLNSLYALSAILLLHVNGFAPVLARFWLVSCTICATSSFEKPHPALTLPLPPPPAAGGAGGGLFGDPPLLQVLQVFGQAFLICAPYL